MFKIVIDITNDEKIIFRQCLKFETLKKAEKVFKNLYDDIYILFMAFMQIFIYSNMMATNSKNVYKKVPFILFGAVFFYFLMSCNEM